jgi:hypothetical protein
LKQKVGSLLKIVYMHVSVRNMSNACLTQNALELEGLHKRAKDHWHDTQSLSNIELDTNYLKSTSLY